MPRELRRRSLWFLLAVDPHLRARLVAKVLARRHNLSAPCLRMLPLSEAERSMPGIEVCVVEDDEVTREHLVHKINQIDGQTVIWSAATLADAHRLLATTSPDILLVDLKLPDGDGTSLIAEQTSRRPAMPILVISVFGDEERVVNAISAGAQGYLLKDDEGEEIAEAIQRMMDGESPISPSIATHLIKRFQSPHRDEAVGVTVLSERELEVLSLATKGLTYQETADLMGVTVNTVGTFTKRVYTKLAVNSRAEAIFEARQLGLMPKD